MTCCGCTYHAAPNAAGSAGVSLMRGEQGEGTDVTRYRVSMKAEKDESASTSLAVVLARVISITRAAFSEVSCGGLRVLLSAAPCRG